MNKSSPRMSALTKTLFGLTLFALTQMTIAQQMEFNKNYAGSDEDTKPWEEIKAILPPAPKAEDMLPFYVGPTATQTFAIDSKSLSIGMDGVIRFTLIAASSSGAKNISYEGIRCASFEKKIYALGLNDGTWSSSRRDDWEGIERGNRNRQHAALALDYFCSNLTIAGKEADMLQRIKYRTPLTDELLR